MKAPKSSKTIKSMRLSSLDGVKDVTVNAVSPTRAWNNVYAKSPAPLADETKFDDVSERWDRMGIKF